jgi:hypothetical protein
MIPIQGPDKRFVALGPHQWLLQEKKQYIIYDNVLKTSLHETYETFDLANYSAKIKNDALAQGVLQK